jgi:hypothetical protein
MIIKSIPVRSCWIFFIFLATFAYFFPRWADWNANSRFDLVLAVVDQGTLAIDSYYQNTGDYAFYKGHYYSDKAPGTAFLGIPVYRVFKTFFGQLLTERVTPLLAKNAAFAMTMNPAGEGFTENKIYFFASLTFVTFFAVAIPSAFLGLLFYQLLTRFSKNEVYKIGLAVGFSFATPVFAYANLFLGHMIAAFCLFVSFYLLFGWTGKGVFRLIAVGFLLTYSLITEYPTVLIVVALGLYALYKVPDWFQRGWIALGGIPPLVLAIVYNWTIFGTPLPVGYEYSALWQDVHRIGFLSLTWPSVEALWGISFSSYRGLFFISPFLLMAIPGFYFFWQKKEYQPEFWVCAWSVASFFLFNGSSAMWSGGFAVGPRYLVPILPFLAFPIIFLLEYGQNNWFRVLTGILIVVSLALVWVETIGGQGYPQIELNPLMDYSLPRILAGDIARNLGMVVGLRGLYSLIPLMFLGILLLVLVIKGPGADSRGSTI